MTWIVSPAFRHVNPVPVRWCPGSGRGFPGTGLGAGGYPAIVYVLGIALLKNMRLQQEKPDALQRYLYGTHGGEGTIFM
jgi:hypothetical protein